MNFRREVLNGDVSKSDVIAPFSSFNTSRHQLYLLPSLSERPPRSFRKVAPKTKSHLTEIFK
jgi:hypothetical protein